MMQTSGAGEAPGARAAIGALALAFVLAVVSAWATQRQLDTWLGALDESALDDSADVLEQLVARQGKQLAATVALLSEDTRIRAMVLTPTFDRATAVDLLTDLQATSGASVLAMLDSGGAVRAVVGAPELDQLDLGTSSLVRSGLEKPSAQLWAFGDKVGVLSVAAVRLDSQVRAMFMMGYEIEDAVLVDIERTVGATGAVFVGERLVATASQAPEVERALRTAAQRPGRYEVAGGAFLASSAPLRDSAVSATSVWLIPRHHRAEGWALARGLSWALSGALGLLLAALVGLWRKRLWAGPTSAAAPVGYPPVSSLSGAGVEPDRRPSSRGDGGLGPRASGAEASVRRGP